MFLLVALLLTVSPSSPALPPGKGKAIVQRMCTSCHALKVVTSKRATPEQWSQLVDQMVSRGAEGTDEEVETVVEYLSKNFGPNAPPSEEEKKTSATPSVNVNQATAAELSSALGLSSEESAAIVSYREQNGKFKEWQELTKVPGVEAAKIEKIKDRLQF